MKINKIVFWSSTGIISAFMLMSSFMYLTKNQQVVEGIKLVGIPYFIIALLGVAKFLGSIALLYPREHILKEWAYAGFTFTFIGAIWTHISTNTSFIGPLIALLFLGISYAFRKKAIVSKNG